MDGLLSNIIAFIVMASAIFLFVGSVIEKQVPMVDYTKLADIGLDCRDSDEYKCVDEILRSIFYATPYYTAKQTQHIGIFHALWEKVWKSYYKQYETNRIVCVKAKDIVIETKYCSGHIFIAMYIPKLAPLRRITPGTNILPEVEYFIGMILPDDALKSKYITLKTEGKNKVVSIWTDDDICTKHTTKSSFEMDSFKEILLDIAKADVDSWNQCSQSYDGLPWMISLWKWADKNNISIYNLPRNKKQLLALEELNLSFVILNDLPKEMGNLQNLKKLSLTGCGLITLPVEICKLTKLETLSIVGNGIEYLPREFCMLKNLKLIDARMSALKQLPICMGKLNGLTVQVTENNTDDRRIS